MVKCLLVAVIAAVCLSPVLVDAGDNCGSSVVYKLSSAGGSAASFSYTLTANDISASRTCSWIFDATSDNSASYISLTSFSTTLGGMIVFTASAFLSILDERGGRVSDFRQSETLQEDSYLPLKFTLSLSGLAAPAGTSVVFYYRAVSDSSTVYALGCPSGAIFRGNRFYVSTDMDGFGLLPLGDNVQCSWSLVCASPVAVLVANISVTSQMQTNRYFNDKVGQHIFPLVVRALGFSVSGGISMTAYCASGTYSISRTMSLPERGAPSTAAPRSSTMLPPTTPPTFPTQTPVTANRPSLSSASPAPFVTNILSTAHPSPFPAGTTMRPAVSTAGSTGTESPPSTTAAPTTNSPLTSIPMTVQPPATTMSICCTIAYQESISSVFAMWSTSAGCPNAQICIWSIVASSVCRTAASNSARIAQTSHSLLRQVEMVAWHWKAQRSLLLLVSR